MGGTVAQAHERQQLVSPGAGFLSRLAGDVGGNHDVLDGGELGEQLVELEDEAQTGVTEVGEAL